MAVSLDKIAAPVTLQQVAIAADRIVRNDVIVCVSSLISTLAGAVYQDGGAAKAIREGIADEDTFAGLMMRSPTADEYEESDDTFVRVNGKMERAYRVVGDDDGFRWEECEPIILADDGKGEVGTWCDTALEAWQELFDDQRYDAPDGVEVFEHWAVSSWLADKLEAKGETVARDVAGLIVWGRCTSGQGIAQDYVIQSIAREMLEA